MKKVRFKEALLEKKEFVYTLELVPGRGSWAKTQDDILKDVIGLEIYRLGIDRLSISPAKIRTETRLSQSFIPWIELASQTSS